MDERQLATAARVPVARIRELCRLGLMTGDRFSSGDVSRVRLIDACERAGLGAGNLAEAVARGRLSFAFLDLEQYAWPAHLERTFGQLCADRGLDVETVRRLYEAAALPSPAADAPARDDDAPLLDLIAVVSGVGIDEHVMTRAMRLYGQNLQRMAAAETNLYHDLIEMPVLRSGLPETEMRELTSKMVDPIDRPLRAAVQTLWERQREHHWIADMVEHIEQALDEIGLAPPRDPPAISFVDLSGFTRFTEEHGDARAADIAAELGDITSDVSRRHRGEAIKWLGDGVMSYFAAPSDAVGGAIEIVRRVEEEGLPPAHVGLAAGPVVVREGDYFGRTVNLASRIADVAGPRQILVTEEIVRRADDAAVRFEEMGAVELKGMGEPIRLHRVEDPATAAS